MKKLKDLIKTKEGNEKSSATEKKGTEKNKKLETAPPDHTSDQHTEQELFWDGYSDIGYC